MNVVYVWSCVKDALQHIRIEKNQKLLAKLNS